MKVFTGQNRQSKRPLCGTDDFGRNEGGRRSLERIEIINNLKRDGAWYRFNGIIFASVENLADEEIFKLLRYLKDNQVQMAGRPIGWYAIAALDMFGAEKYTGSDPDIVRFVSEYPDIVQGIQEAERKKNLSRN